MKCPRCDSNLVSSDVSKDGNIIVIDRCPKCDGLWFDKTDLNQILLEYVEETIEFQAVEGGHIGLACPRCITELQPLSPKEAKDLVIDRCPACEGFWLDKGELEKIVNLGKTPKASPWFDNWVEDILKVLDRLLPILDV